MFCLFYSMCYNNVLLDKERFKILNCMFVTHVFESSLELDEILTVGFLPSLFFGI